MTLIVPSQALVMPRRKFLIGSGQLVASLFVAPSIIKASNLMHIDSLDNRLVPAFFCSKSDIATYRRKGTEGPGWCESLINLSDYTDPMFEIWKSINSNLKYDLVRRGSLVQELDFTPYDRERERHAVVENIRNHQSRSIT